MNIFLEATAGEYMTQTVKTVTRDVSMRDLEMKFAEYGFNAFPVQEKDDIVGLVTKFDFLRMFCLDAEPDGSALCRTDGANGRRRDDG